MLVINELQRSLQILKRDSAARFEQFSKELDGESNFSEEHFGQLWDKLRRDLREVARSVYDEHWRDYRKAKNLE